MSPSWRDRIGISLAPGQVGLLRFSRGLKPELAQSEVATAEAEGEDTSGGTAIRLLATLLAGEGMSQADVSVTVSNHFVRHAVLPWSEVVSDQDWQALAQHQFRTIYGNGALEWAITVAWQGPERPVVACALPKALLERIDATVRGAGLKLRSVSPYFVAAFNFCRARLPEQEFWFGVVEAGRFTFGGVERGTWSSVASRRMSGDSAPRLSQMLEQEVLGGDGSAARGRAFVFSPEQELTVIEEGGDWSIERLSLLDIATPVTDPRLAAALTALA